MEWQLAENPPTDRLVALYFIGNKWWEPPSRTEFAHDVRDDGEPQIWESPLLGEAD